MDGGYAANLPVDVMHAFLPGTIGLTIACDVERKDGNRTWLDILPSDFGTGDDISLSGWYVLYRLVRGWLGLGPPLSIPWSDDLFLQVSYLRHYSSLRSLLSDASYDSAMEEPEMAGSLHGGASGGNGGESTRLGGPAGAAASSRPSLLYVRPPVGRFGLLDYAQMGLIIDLGASATAAALQRWERTRGTAGGELEAPR